MDPRRSFVRSAVALVAPLVAPLLGATAAGQANQDPNLDVRLARLRDITALGRVGTFPAGVSGLACETTVCNQGTTLVPWIQPMSPNHPTIAFLVAKVRDGRMVQVSNRSYLKHGFFAANANGCGTCVQPPTGVLGLGCSDTYSTANNGDNFFLGPPDEVDPWLGTWDPACSHFDRGAPDVGAPANCDGFRSLTRTQANGLGPVHSRVQVHDLDFSQPGELFFQAHYVVRGMPEAARADALGSRPFTASFVSGRWVLDESGPLRAGSVLQRWSGASVSSATNGADDGRVYVALRVTGPVAGFWRYEYVLHNRDNARGVGALRIPLCRGARVRSLGFQTPEFGPADAWDWRVVGDELVLAGPRALEWNTLTNVWFESDAAPADAALVLAAATPGAGAPEFLLASRAPLALYNVHLGPGCALDVPPTLYALGDPPRAALGNASFALGSSGNAPLQPSLLYLGTQPGSRSIGGCTLWLGATPGRQRLVSLALSDAQGLALHPAPVPDDPTLEGQLFRLQALARDPGRGVISGDFELSEGLLVRLGNALAGCP